MRPGDDGIAGLIAARRADGAARRDPVRFHFIEALARRAAAHEGEARRVIDAKLRQALQALGEARAPEPPAAGHRCPPSPLAELLRDHAGAAAQPAPGPAAFSAPAAPVELKTLRLFRSSWARLAVDQRLHQARAKAPENAGPLHSQAVALRGLDAMREISPQYLGRFVAHLDALAWLERVGAGSVAVPATRGEKQPPRR
ncbi:conserved hypothetical protein [Rubrivivax sp. A210]|nr:conserved hypothetical protein [Rubrivivax sp. A210]